jgi:hypothetical protein
VPVLVLFALLAVAFTLAALDRLPLPAYVPVLVKSALVFGAATVAMAVAVWRRWPAAGVGVALAAMIAFLPMAGEGMAQFARGRSVRLLTEALILRLAPADRIVHEGPLENSASLLLAIARPVHVVDGLQSSLAFGATFPEARDVFWSTTRLRQAWAGPARCFLVSTVAPDRSVSRSLEPLYRLAEGGGRWLYSNRPD